MPPPKLSVNLTGKKLVMGLCEKCEEYGVIVEKTKTGATLIDTGIKARGGLLAGKVITEICLGGYGEASISCKRYGDIELPSIFVYTDHPAVATLGSQFAGWQIKFREYSAMGSGPARSLALKPKELYEKIKYEDKADEAVLVLETNREPSEDTIKHISCQCKVAPTHLYLILVPTNTITGSTQISGRVVETGIHKLMNLGFDPGSINHACGYAPIAPVHPGFAESMGRTNDAILYAGVTCYFTSYDDDEKLKKLVNLTPSMASKNYGRPFLEIFKEAKFDFYKIDPNLFAPAVVIVNNVKTGNIFMAGKINMEVFRRSIGL